MTDLLAGVELGGTKCICLLARGPDEIVAREVIATGAAGPTLAQIAAVLRRWRSGHRVESLGIASFGPLDLDKASPGYGHLVSTPKPGWTGADLTSLAEGLPVAIDTDVNGAALAEGRWGAARGLASWCYITVGTGVGVGTVIGGAPIHGLGHSEAGHMRVPVADGVEGSCPFHGNCIEGLVSGPALALRTGMDSGAIPDDHPVWEQAAGELAALCHNLVCTVMPQRIVLGGGVVQRRPHLVARTGAKLSESLAGYASGAAIAASIESFLVGPALGDDAGPLGAIALADTAKSL